MKSLSPSIRERKRVGKRYLNLEKFPQANSEGINFLGIQNLIETPKFTKDNPILSANRHE